MGGFNVLNSGPFWRALHLYQLAFHILGIELRLRWQIGLSVGVANTMIQCYNAELLVFSFGVFFLFVYISVCIYILCFCLMASLIYILHI